MRKKSTPQKVVIKLLKYLLNKIKFTCFLLWKIRTFNSLSEKVFNFNVEFL
jgi:hypothetical protein